MTHAIALPAVQMSSLERFDPLGLAIAGYLAKFRGTTFTDYRTDLRHFLDWCDRNGLAPLQARRPHLELYVRWLEDTGWASSTVARRFGTVAGFYKYACIDELIEKDPAVHVARPKVDKAAQKRTVFSALEFGILCDVASKTGPMEHALIALLGLRGLRIAEACQIDIEDVTIARGYDCITTTRKGGKRTTLSLPVPVARAVREAVGERTEGPLLLNQWGRRMDRAAATRMLKRLCRAAHISEDRSPHSCRRTFVTTSLAIGIPLADVQAAAGHASPNTTMIYNVPSAAAGHDRDAAHRLASYVSGIAS